MQASWSPKDSLVVVAGSKGAFQVYDMHSYEFLGGVLVSNEPLYTAKFIRGNKLVICGGKNEKVNLFLWKTAEQGMDLPLGYTITDIILDKNQSAFAIHNTKGTAEIITLPDFQAWGALEADTLSYHNLSFVSKLDFNHNSTILSNASIDHSINLNETSTKKNINYKAQHNSFVSQVKFSPKSRFLASVDIDQQITVADLQNFDFEASKYVPLKILKANTDYTNWVSFNPDSTLSFVGQSLYNWDLKTAKIEELHVYKKSKILGQRFNEIKVGNKTINYSKKYKVIISGDLKIMSYNFSPDRSLAVFTTKDKCYHFNLKEETVKSFKPKIKLYKREKLHIDNQGEITIVSRKNIVKYDNSGKELWIKEVGQRISGIEINPVTEEMLVTNYYDTLEVLNYGTSKTIESFFVGEYGALYARFINDKEIVIIGRDEFRVVNKKGEVLSKKSIDFTLPMGMQLSYDKKLIAVPTSDRSIDVYKLNNGKIEKLYELFGLNENGVFVKSNNDYYMASKMAYKNISFKYGEEYYPLEQFDGYLNKPHKVLEISPYKNELIEEYLKKAVIKRSKKQKFPSQIELENLPKIKILDKHLFQNVVQESFVEFDVEVLKGKSEVEKYNVYIDGVPLYGLNGKRISSNSFKVKTPLIPGLNNVSVIAYDVNGLPSLKDELKVTLQKEDEPTLYMVSLGVSKYEDVDYNLTYAAKDAKDVAQAFAKSAVFKEVKKKVILNEDVTLKSLDDIRAFVKEAKPSDVVVIFIAGHGTLDEDYNYYFAGHNMSFHNPKLAGVSYTDIQLLLNDLPTIRKVLFMDTCHSGEVDEEDVEQSENTNTEEENIEFRAVGNKAYNVSAEKALISDMATDLFIDTRKGTGATIISSASGMEVAREGKEWSNGLFTYCLLYGIKSGEADLDNNGQIWLSEIQEYVNEKVGELSGGKQTPTARSLNLSIDYRIW